MAEAALKLTRLRPNLRVVEGNRDRARNEADLHWFFNEGESAISPRVQSIGPMSGAGGGQVKAYVWEPAEDESLMRRVGRYNRIASAMSRLEHCSARVLQRWFTIYGARCNAPQNGYDSVGEYLGIKGQTAIKDRVTQAMDEFDAAAAARW